MFLCPKYLLYSTEILLDIGNMVSKFRVINGEYIVKISKGIVELVYEFKPFGFLEVSQNIPLVTIQK